MVVACRQDGDPPDGLLRELDPQRVREAHTDEDNAADEDGIDTRHSATDHRSRKKRETSKHGRRRPADADRRRRRRRARLRHAHFS